MSRALDLSLSTGRDSHNPNFLARRAYAPGSARTPLVTGLGPHSTHRGLLKCKWCTLVLDAGRIEAHLDQECALVPIQCALPDSERPSQECPVKVQGWERMRAHQKTCPYTLVACPSGRCNARVSRRSIKIHMEVCPYQRVACPTCQARYFRVDQDYHATVCPEAEIVCPLMCGERFRRKHLAHHLKDRLLSHSYINLQTSTDYLPPDHPTAVYAMLLKQMKDLKIQTELARDGGASLLAAGPGPTARGASPAPGLLPPYATTIASEDSVLSRSPASPLLLDERSGLQRVSGLDVTALGTREEDLRVMVFTARNVPASDYSVRLTFGDRTLETTRGAGVWHEEVTFPGSRQPPNPQLLVELVQARKQILGAAIVDLTTAKSARVEKWIPLSWDGRPAGEVHMRIEGEFMESLLSTRRPASGSATPASVQSYLARPPPPLAAVPVRPGESALGRTAAARAPTPSALSSRSTSGSPPPVAYPQRYQDCRGLVHMLMAAIDRTTQEVLQDPAGARGARLRGARQTLEDERREVLQHATALLAELAGLLAHHADRPRHAEVRVDNSTVMAVADLQTQKDELDTSVRHLEQAWFDLKTALFEAKAH